MGAKTGYADAILSRLGLQPGQGARRYLWCEPDAGCRLLLEAYRSRELAQAAAAIIRGWSEEDPRSLWERLKAEGPVKAPEPREVARWGFLSQAAYRRGMPKSGYDDEVGRGRNHPATVVSPALNSLPELPGCIVPDATEVDPRELARWVYGTATSYDTASTWTGFVHPESGGRYGASRQAQASRLEGLPELRSELEREAEAVDPREVARWLRIVTSNRLINLDPETWRNTGIGGSTFGGSEFCTDAASLAEAASAVPELRQAMIAAGAEAVSPSRLPAGSVVYLDPPYYQTTGYAHDIPRPDGAPFAWVEGLARAWSEAGALVAVSEAVPMPGLVAEGWHVVDLTHDRRGQRRTFSRQQTEVLTLNRTPAGQLGLFG
ncbi:MAG: hypothetical protein ACO3RX_00090 [Chthoniobacterales bacterium]